MSSIFAGNAPVSSIFSGPHELIIRRFPLHELCVRSSPYMISVFAGSASETSMFSGPIELLTHQIPLHELCVCSFPYMISVFAGGASMSSAFSGTTSRALCSLILCFCHSIYLSLYFLDVLTWVLSSLLTSTVYKRCVFSSVLHELFSCRFCLYELCVWVFPLHELQVWWVCGEKAEWRRDTES
jgi:hypothetical protein